jgi:alkylhydroperoxidase/carboxymuconolactone decarboxylase family protein YurZ
MKPTETTSRDKADTRQAMPSVDEVRGSIESIRERRGYVLPSHAMLAAAAPRLMEEYEAVYHSITFDFRALDPFEKNFVWLLVIGCAETPTGAHHLTDFIEAGGRAAQVEAAAKLGMIAIGARMLETVAPSWERAFPDYSADSAYTKAIERCAAEAQLPLALVHMALAAGHACRRNWGHVSRHILGAKAAGASDEALVEALTVCILPAGNPGFVQACTVWRNLIKEGKVAASPAFKLSAELT